MDLNPFIKEARIKLKKGQGLDTILDEFSAKGLTTEDIHSIAQHIVASDYRKGRDKHSNPFEHFPFLNPKVYLKFLLILVIFSIGAIIYFHMHDMVMQDRWDRFDASSISEPVQVKYSGSPIIMHDSGKEFTLTPVAEYKVSALVAHAKRYTDDVSIAPYDFALMWGDLASQEYEKYMSVSQSSRRWNYYVKGDAPWSPSYVNSHGANTHIIPSNDEIRIGASKARKNEQIYIEGFLVNLKYSSGSRYYTIKTSTSRTDSGNGACEIVYVKKLILNNQTYE